MQLYPDIILIKVKSVLERDAEYTTVDNGHHTSGSNNNGYASLLKESIALVSGIRLKKTSMNMTSKKGSSSSSSSSSSSRDSSRAKEARFIDLIRSNGVVTSSYRNNSPIYATNGFTIVASSTMLYGASITLVSRKQNEFLGQVMMIMNIDFQR